MSNSLEILSAAKDVSGLLGRFIATYRATRTLSREESVALDEHIRSFRATTRAQNEGKLIRVHIEEIAETQRAIDRENLSGPALAYAMKQLYLLNSLLENDIENYRE